MSAARSAVGRVLSSEQEVLAAWLKLQRDGSTFRAGAITEDELREQSGDLVALLRGAFESGVPYSPAAVEWADVRDFLSELSQMRARRGFSHAETAMFVLSLKQPLFNWLRRELERDPEVLGEALWITTLELDKLALFTMEIFLKSREQVISNQQQELLELSTPVVELWPEILALPLIGTLDSSRTQVVMENLLQAIVRTGSKLAIIDITGVPTVDTLVAQHLLKTVAAARLMGADCIISGIRPQIAQTIVQLGVNLSDVVTKATLADAFMMALRRVNAPIVPAAHATAPAAS